MANTLFARTPKILRNVPSSKEQNIHTRQTFKEYYSIYEINILPPRSQTTQKHNFAEICYIVRLKQREHDSKFKRTSLVWRYS